MPELRWTDGGEPQVLKLDREAVGLGRASDNQLILKDFSVSRHHARLEPRNGGWWIIDLGSTNGIKVNGRYVSDTALADDDRIEIGNFVLSFALGEEADASSVGSSTYIRSLEDFQESFRLEAPSRTEQVAASSARERVLESLAQIARVLLEVDELEPVLEKVMDAVFAHLPADRAYILLLTDEGGEPVLQTARSRAGTELDEVPVSQTIIDLVTRQKVAVLTSDAQADDRFAAGMSVRLHQIRSAMCAPLWLRDSVIGVLFVDTPLATGCFTTEHLDLLTALANYAAVAIDRARLNDFIREEKRIRERLERYHSPAVVEAIVAQHRSGDSGRHETREVTVMFADIVGFTRLCEQAEPAEVARLLAEFFSHATDAVFEFGGTVDKFIGDAIMAFFGAPLARPDHAERAVRACLQLRRRLKRWNDTRQAAGLDTVQVRTALNSGLVVVGEIGSANRVDYTILGNTVNVAARLEELVARPGDIVMGPSTQSAIAHLFPTEHLGNVQLRGLQLRLHAFRLLADQVAPDSEQHHA